MLNLLFDNRLFQDTQDKQNFGKQVTVITALLLVVAPIPSAAEIQGARPSALCPIRVIVESLSFKDVKVKLIYQ